MTTTSELDPKIRFLVLYKDAKWSAKRIHSTINTPLRTVQDWISKIETGIDIGIIHSGRGRKPRITEATKKKIVRTAKRKPSSSSSRTLGKKYNVSKDSVRKALGEVGLEYRSVSQEHILTEEEMGNRVKYCKNMLKRKGRPIDETFFSDEMGINLSDAYSKKAWSYPHKKLKVAAPTRDVRINCWGGESLKEGQHLLRYIRKALDLITIQI